MSEVEENKLFNYIVVERENSYMARILDCSTVCDETACYFCAEIEPLCAQYKSKRYD